MVGVGLRCFVESQGFFGGAAENLACCVMRCVLCLTGPPENKFRIATKKKNTVQDVEWKGERGSLKTSIYWGGEIDDSRGMENKEQLDALRNAWNELASANAKVFANTSSGMKPSDQQFRADYSMARQLHRAFWAMPGAYEFARISR